MATGPRQALRLWALIPRRLMPFFRTGMGRKLYRSYGSAKPKSTTTSAREREEKLKAKSDAVLQSPDTILNLHLSSMRHALGLIKHMDPPVHLPAHVEDAFEQKIRVYEARMNSVEQRDVGLETMRDILCLLAKTLPGSRKDREKREIRAHNLFIRKSASEGYDEALEALECMRQAGVGPDYETCNLMILAAETGSNGQAAQMWFSERNRKLSSRSDRIRFRSDYLTALNRVARAWVREGRLDHAKIWFRRILKEKSPPEPETTHLLLDALRHQREVKSMHQILNILSGMPGAEVDRESMSTWLMVLLDLGEIKRAKDEFNSMKKRELLPTTEALKEMAVACAREGDAEMVLELGKLLDSNNPEVTLEFWERVYTASKFNKNPDGAKVSNGYRKVGVEAVRGQKPDKLLTGADGDVHRIESLLLSRLWIIEQDQYIHSYNLYEEESKLYAKSIVNYIPKHSKVYQLVITQCKRMHLGSVGVCLVFHAFKRAIRLPTSTLKDAVLGCLFELKIALKRKNKKKGYAIRRWVERLASFVSKYNLGGKEIYECLAVFANEIGQRDKASEYWEMFVKAGGDTYRLERTPPSPPREPRRSEPRDSSSEPRPSPSEPRTSPSEPRIVQSSKATSSEAKEVKDGLWSKLLKLSKMGREKELKTMVDALIEADAADAESFRTIITFYVERGMREEARYYIDIAKETGYGSVDKIWLAFLDYSQSVREAEDIFQEMKECGVRTNYALMYRTLVESCRRENDVDKAIQWLERMHANVQRSMIPKGVICRLISHPQSRQHKSRLIEIYECHHEKDIHFLNALLASAQTVQQAEETFKEVSRLDLKPNENTFYAILNLAYKLTDFQAFITWFQRMLDNNLWPQDREYYMLSTLVIKTDNKKNADVPKLLTQVVDISKPALPFNTYKRVFGAWCKLGCKSEALESLEGYCGQVRKKYGHDHKILANHSYSELEKLWLKSGWSEKDIRKCVEKL